MVFGNTIVILTLSKQEFLQKSFKAIINPILGMKFCTNTTIVWMLLKSSSEIMLKLIYGRIRKLPWNRSRQLCRTRYQTKTKKRGKRVIGTIFIIDRAQSNLSRLQRENDYMIYISSAVYKRESAPHAIHISGRIKNPRDLNLD